MAAIEILRGVVMRLSLSHQSVLQLSLLSISMILVACNKAPQGAAPAGMPQMPPPEVAVVTVKAQNVPVLFE